MTVGWQKIKTYVSGTGIDIRTSVYSVILWNGEKVFTGSLDSAGVWSCDQYVEHSNDIEPQPTHWMPLPSPPEIDQ